MGAQVNRGRRGTTGGRKEGGNPDSQSGGNWEKFRTRSVKAFTWDALVDLMHQLWMTICVKNKLKQKFKHSVSLVSVFILSDLNIIHTL